MSISHPKFAVAVIVLRQNTRFDPSWEVLMVALKKDHSRWSLPGGKLDPIPTAFDAGGTPRLRFAEGPKQAAVRELREETGIDCRQDHLVELETVLDSGGYLTTFYVLTANFGLPDTFNPQEGEAPVQWGSLHILFNGPFGAENQARFRKMGIIS